VALQTVPPLSPHKVPSGSGVFEGTPLLQVSVVHPLVSFGTSVSSATEVMLPAPSQTFFWQSPAVCWMVGVPAGILVNPQTPATQVRTLHSVSVPGQSVAKRQAGTGAVHRRFAQVPEQHCLPLVHEEPSP
jgi:hypothetical protein